LDTSRVAHVFRPAPDDESTTSERAFLSQGPAQAVTRILIVDDDPDIHRLLRARLEARGYTVQSAFNGAGALALFKDFSPDVAFLDVAMPGLGGLDMLQVIRAQDLDMAVVLTAASGSEQVAIDALRQGADDCLRKPFDRGEFQAVLDRAVSRLTLARQNAILRRQLRIELGRAAEVQADLLPPNDPVVPGFELAARCVPAGEVGGDFYDWQQLSPTLLGLTVGDVMGKGIPAALMMATVRAALRAAALQNGPASAMQTAARTLDQDLTRFRSFVTLFHAQLDVTAARLTYVDAGHGYVLFRRADGTLEELRPWGLPLGILTDEVYEEGSILLNPGDVLVVYSDGLTEALPDLLRDRSALAAEIDGATSAAALVRQLIERACAAGPGADDLTIAVLRHCESPRVSSPTS
jgi:serine phosphatase RsbU (regulator of sigma subunit)